MPDRKEHFAERYQAKFNNFYEDILRKPYATTLCVKDIDGELACLEYVFVREIHDATDGKAS